jgi:hypothetical protein
MVVTASIEAHQQQGELPVAEACDVILLAPVAPQQSHQIAQQAIAGSMAPAVVHQPQIVDVEAEQRQGEMVAAGLMELMAADREKGAAIRHSGDRTEQGTVPQLDLMHHHLG